MIRLYFALTAHGFGHASRASALLAELSTRLPRLHVILNTGAPEWFLEAMLGPARDRARAAGRQFTFEIRRAPLDVGIVQSDSLNMDLAATLAALQDLEARRPALLAAEAEFLRAREIDMIFADLPALAGDLGKLSGVPCFAQGNFGWDFIYDALGAEFRPYAARMRESHAHVEHLFHLPFAEPMTSFPARESVGLTGFAPGLNADVVRELLQLSDDAPAILLTFGGMGLARIPYQNALRFDGRRFPRRTFVSFDADAPALPNLRRVADLRIRPVDVMAIASAVLSKPGYGSFCEALRVNLPYYCIRRDGFAESRILLEDLQRFFRHRIVELGEFYESDWRFLLEEPRPPSAREGPADGGNSTIAGKLIAALGERRVR